MSSIKEIKNTLKEGLYFFLKENKFVLYHHAFYCHRTDLIKVIQLQHLDTNMASTFHTNTASFFIRLGVFYNFIPLDHEIDKDKIKNILLPKEYECHIRKTLCRDFKQNEDLIKNTDFIDQNSIIETRKWLFKKNPLLKPKRKLFWFKDSENRKDIWYVKNDGSNLNNIVKSVKEIIGREGMKWFEEFSDLDFVNKFLLSKPEEDSVMGGTFGFGKKGSPIRNFLLGCFANKLKNND